MIKRFKITKLFGFRTVDIPFENDIKILIGENGLGKTTILNCLYYVLNSRWDKLYNIDFERIELQLSTNDKIKFTKRELYSFIRYSGKLRRRIYGSEIIEKLNIDELQELLEEINFDSHTNKHRNITSEKRLITFLEENNVPVRAPLHMIVRELQVLVSEPSNKKFFEFRDSIKELNLSILYFPTYRRVEEDLKNLGKFKDKESREDNFYYNHDGIIEDIEKDDDDTLIHFGMEDVEQRIKDVIDKISNSTVEGFSKVTGEILTQLLQGFPDIEDSIIKNLDIQTAKIVLHRVGHNISEHDRKSIMSLLEDPQSLIQKKELTYFLVKLIDIYNQHKHLDDALKKFRDVCNEYLVDKEIRYFESNVSLGVFRENTNDEVALNKLSSGEKQIISLFSKIYLDLKKDFVVLFDEPELSLSIQWQKLLLPHIVSSEKCKFLLSVTHSPFIFNNELDEFAVGMHSYIK